MRAAPLSAVVLAAVFGLSTASAQSFFGRNVIYNNGAELVTSPPLDPLFMGLPAGWSTSGNFQVEAYGTPQLPSCTDPGSANRGLRFFSGGPNNASSSALQVIVVPPDAFTLIDSGLIKFNLEGWLGGYGMEDDNAVLTVDFKNGANS